MVLEAFIVYKGLKNIYRPRMREGNVFVLCACVCVCVCVCVMLKYSFSTFVVNIRALGITLMLLVWN